PLRFSGHADISAGLRGGPLDKFLRISPVHQHYWMIVILIEAGSLPTRAIGRFPFLLNKRLSVANFLRRRQVPSCIHKSLELSNRDWIFPDVIALRELHRVDRLFVVRRYGIVCAHQKLTWL